MDAVLRAAVMYGVLLVLFRVSGKRSLAQATTFDFVLLLIVGEATQQALLGDDFSLTKALLVILTLLVLDLGMQLIQRSFPNLGKWIDDVPLVLVEDGKVLKRRMDKSRVSEAEIMEAARLHHGLERLDQVKFAVLERTGAISIVPKAGEG